MPKQLTGFRRLICIATNELTPNLTIGKTYLGRVEKAARGNLVFRCLDDKGHLKAYSIKKFHYKVGGNKREKN